MALPWMYEAFKADVSEFCWCPADDTGTHLFASPNKGAEGFPVAVSHWSSRFA